MDAPKQRITGRTTTGCLAVAVVAASVVLVTAATLSASGPNLPPFPQLNVFKGASMSTIGLGDRISFFIAAENPAEPDDPWPLAITRYHVTATDPITPILQIEEAGLIFHEGELPKVEVSAGNVVTVTVDVMEPGDNFVLRIDCTLVGPLPNSSPIRNVATVIGWDAQGNPEGPYHASTEVAVVYQRIFPIVMRHYRHTPR